MCSCRLGQQKGRGRRRRPPSMQQLAFAYGLLQNRRELPRPKEKIKKIVKCRSCGERSWEQTFRVTRLDTQTDVPLPPPSPEASTNSFANEIASHHPPRFERFIGGLRCMQCSSACSGSTELSSSTSTGVGATVLCSRRSGKQCSRW